MKLSYQIDWIAFTDPALLPMTDIMPFSWVKPDAARATPLRGYNACFRMPAGRVDWHTERQSQRRLWTFTGSDLTALENNGMTNESMIEAVSAIHDAHVTRLDFAVDVRDAGASPDDIENAWHNRTLTTHARRMKVIEAFRDGRGASGKTVYIGSRQSPMMLRVYDKGAEQQTGEDWIRIELEMKHPTSTKVLAQMATRGVANIGTAAIRSFVDAPQVDWYTDALSGAGEVDLRRGRKQTDWEKWVMSVALPNVLKALETNVQGVRAALETALMSPALPPK